MTANRPRKTLWLLGGIFVLALAVRGAAVLVLGVQDLFTASESGQIAANLIAGKGFTFDFYGLRPAQPLIAFLPPLFPLLIATCQRLFGDTALALGLLQALLASLTAVMLYVIGSRLSGSELTGLLAAAMGALYPVFVLMTTSPASYTVDAFVLALVLVSLVLLRDDMTVASAANAGLAFGVALLARPMLVVVAPLAIAWLWLAAPRLRGRLPRVAAVLMGCALLVMLPWTIRNYAPEHEPVFVATNGGFNFWQGNNSFTTGSGLEVRSADVDAFLGRPHDPDAPAVFASLAPYPLPREIQAQVSAIDETRLDRMLYGAGLAFVRDNPGRWLQLALVKLQAFWGFRANIGVAYRAAWTPYYKLLYVGVLCLALPGIWLSLRRWRSYALLYLLFAYYTGFYVIFQVLTRYRWEIEPYLLIFAAVTVEYVALAVRERRGSAPAFRH